MLGPMLGRRLGGCLSVCAPRLRLVTPLPNFVAPRLNLVAPLACSLATSGCVGSKIALVLSGCGVYDGTEVHEASAAMAAITRAGATLEVFAPVKEQFHVVDHTNGDAMDQTRNVLSESARIARTKPRPLTELTVDEADAVIFPGGFGAAKNLSSFGYEGADMKVDPEVARVITEFHAAGKPQGLCCISPVLAAKVLGEKGVTLTLGNTGSEADWPYQGAIEAAKSWGASMELKDVDEVCVDGDNKLVSTPAYMSGSAHFHQVHDGVSAMVKQVLSLV